MLLLLVGAAVVVMGLVVFWVEPLGVLGVLERLTPNIVYRVRTKLPLVALSFDDGPHPEFTAQVLEILKRYEAKATFFLIGERALRYPEVVVRIRAEGHEIGNHYFKNGATLGHSDEEFLGNLEKTERAIGAGEKLAVGSETEPIGRFIPLNPRMEQLGVRCETEPIGRSAFPGKLELFRPPGGVAWPRQIRLARERGYTCVLGCAYPHDPMHPPVWYIRWLIEKNLVPGTIVILHDGIANPKRSIAALPHILAAGSEKGLRFVSIGELMGTR
jgi:peptidoglycan/xylan/chitin deacetylase (PgdA/CDA1 family)